jgi:hypothetical protein
LVQFRIRDIYLPDPQEVAVALCGDLLLRGRVIDQSDGGPQGRFLVIAVEGLERPMVVAADRVSDVP